MLQYLIIQLDDTSTSYCHYSNDKKESRLISVENLKKGILFAMKENLMIQFVYPNFELSQEYKDAINTIDHSDIVPSDCEDERLRDNADIIIFNNWKELESYKINENGIYVIRTSKSELFENHLSLNKVFPIAKRINVVITDIDSFDENDFEKYKEILSSLSKEIEKLYVEGKTPQLNLLTDRMMLDKMNNCNAGDENITLAPDGKFYVCPAFYLTDENEDYGLGKSKFSIGDLENGLEVKNPQLYKLSYAPICRNCDAYQCKRCVYLNRKTTYELNTPGHEQCVVSHLERNESRELLANIRKHGMFLPDKEIKEISYLDPFDVRKEW